MKKIVAFLLPVRVLYAVCFLVASFFTISAKGQTPTVTMVAGFNAVESGPLKISFTDTSLATISFSGFPIGTAGANSWAWYFGDGTTATEQNPVHTYSSAGTYTVCLAAKFDSSSVLGTLSASDSICKAVTVSAPKCIYPVFNWSDTYLSVQFSDSSKNNTATASSWTWNFGDGATSTQQNPSHVYAAANTYSVCLTVSDGGSCNETLCQNVTVNAKPCVASFTYVDNLGVVDFTDASSYSGGSFAYDTTWTWSFGDGTTATEQNPQHTYAASSTYTVCLNTHYTAISETCDDSVCNTINVVVGIVEQTQALHFAKVYPNPAGNTAVLTYYLVTDAPVTIMLHDLSGRKVAAFINEQEAKGAHAIPLQLSDIETGIYFLRISDGRGFHTEKLSVVR